MEIFSNQIKKDDSFNSEEKINSKSYFCLLISRYWCRVLAIVIISIVYCTAEIIKELIQTPKNKVMMNLFCKLFLLSNNISSIDVCKEEIKLVSNTELD